MTIAKDNTARRRVLKSTALFSGSMIAAKALPKSWSKPVVDAVLLPAHAATTDTLDDLSGASPTHAPIANPCLGEFATIGADDFAIDIVYDGASTPSFSIRNQSNSRLPEDTVVGVSKIPSFAMGAGRNWQIGEPRIESNVADGLYTRTITRMVDGQPTGDRFALSFCIATMGEDATRTLTVTLVSINRI